MRHKMDCCVVMVIGIIGLGSQVWGAEWEFLPERGRAFLPLLADPREAVVRLGYMREGDTFAELGLGGDLGLLSVASQQGTLTLSGRALVNSRFEFGSGAFDLINTDYIGAAALGYEQDRWQWELCFYHQSSHLGDEMMIPPARRSAIRYNHESLRFLLAHEFWDCLRLYTGPSIRIHSVPESFDSHWSIQLGSEWSRHIGHIPIYLATDIQWRELDQWQRDWTTQIGFFLGYRDKNVHRKRVFLEYHDGLSTMGQYYNDNESYTMIGFSMDL